MIFPMLYSVRLVKSVHIFLCVSSSFYFIYLTLSYYTKMEFTDIRQDISKPYVKIKYILLWKGDDSPSAYLGTGRSSFMTKNKCKWNNCFITSDRHYLQNYTEFDAILFNGPRLWNTAVTSDLPKLRSTHQKYVYANVESAANYPITTHTWDGFFNWTWTYRLDSDSLWGYVAIRNASNQVIGPNMNWMKISDMKPISQDIKKKLKSKVKAAAWFSSNCETIGARERLVAETQKELQKYGLDVDIYGSCGPFVCTRDIMDQCLSNLENTYYFYFAFENSLCEDYVTEKILYALQHNTVPVVYGGANYSRFMPEGIYLDALKLGPKGLARKISDVMRYPELYYYDFFRWKNHYSYHYRGDSSDTDDYCNFCAILNDEKLIESKTTYNNFKEWWKTNLSFTDYKSYKKNKKPAKCESDLHTKGCVQTHDNNIIN